MRFIVIFMSLLTIILSSYPCCQETAKCSEVSTIEHCDSDNDSKDHPQGEDSPCSPFYTCGRCPGFTADYPRLDFNNFEFQKKPHPVPYLEPLPKEVYFFSLKPPRSFEV